MCYLTPDTILGPVELTLGAVEAKKIRLPK
jgi:hypothetical protein